jgi:hypothetical protein
VLPFVFRVVVVFLGVIWVFVFREGVEVFCEVFVSLRVGVAVLRVGLVVLCVGLVVLRVGLVVVLCVVVVVLAVVVVEGV